MFLYSTNLVLYKNITRKILTNYYIFYIYNNFTNKEYRTRILSHVG